MTFFTCQRLRILKSTFAANCGAYFEAQVFNCLSSANLSEVCRSLWGAKNTVKTELIANGGEDVDALVVKMLVRSEFLKKVCWVAFGLSWLSRQDWILQRMVEQMPVLVLSVFSLRDSFWRGFVNASWKSLLALWTAWSVQDFECGPKHWTVEQIWDAPAEDELCQFWVPPLEAPLKACVGQKMWRVRLSIGLRTRRLMKKIRWPSQSAWFGRAPSFLFSFVVSHDLLSVVIEVWGFLWLSWLLQIGQ